eukprot:CAMPEP_0198146138 /NCGR_PEP_ID=MMETSP1443-20131203/27625_1 /TAXON_ID=186043 /ORGANISM="Entomoneis sp., Strain CCMP2396" /LENGTH=151 /DNA_ID=CAMNT_0043809989 /DNA_START=64 /DNA_END=519 /DNA_ORIENTATION=+
MTHQASPRQAMLIEDDSSCCRSSNQACSHRARHNTSRSSSSSKQIPNFFKFPCNPQDMRIQKRKFLVFVRVLVGYLDRKDPSLCQRVHSAVRDCSKRNRRREPGYESCVISIHGRLREMVTYHHWMRAGEYLRAFIRRQRGAQLRVVPDEA